MYIILMNTATIPRLLEAVNFAVGETFSFLSGEQVTPEALFKHICERLGERFGLSPQQADKFYKPIYWSLVYAGEKPDKNHLFHLNGVLNKSNGKAGPLELTTYIARRDNINLADKSVRDLACQRIIKEYKETLEARLSTPHQPA